MRNNAVRAARREQLLHRASPPGRRAPQDACRASSHIRGTCYGPWACSSGGEPAPAALGELGAAVGVVRQLTTSADVFQRAPRRRTPSDATLTGLS